MIVKKVNISRDENSNNRNRIYIYKDKIRYKNNTIKLEISFMIIIGIVLSIISSIFLYHICNERLWDGNLLLSNFHFYNSLLLIIFGLIVFISLYFLIKTSDYLRWGNITLSISLRKIPNKFHRKFNIFFISFILMLIAIITWTPINETETLGFIGGIFGAVGLFLFFLSLGDLDKKIVIGITVFFIGVLIVILAPIHEAFNLRDVGLWDIRNIILIIVGIIIASCGIILLEKEKYFTGVKYFTFFTFGAFVILLIPLHETISLNSTKSYGEFDITLMVFGSFIMYFGVFLYITKKWKNKPVLDYIELGNKNYIFARREKDRILSLEYYIKSIICYVKAIILYSNYAIVWNNIGNALREIGMLNDAIKCYEKAIELDENYDLAYNGKGVVFLKRKNYIKALVFFGKALEINSNNKEAWNNKGIAFYYLKSYKDALHCFERALEIDSIYEVAIRNKLMCVKAMKPPINRLDVDFKKQLLPKNLILGEVPLNMKKEEQKSPGISKVYYKNIKYKLYKDKIGKVFSVENLYFEKKESLIKQITTALKNKKHIILIGPPGCGKSSLAKIICEFYCGDGNYGMSTATSDWSTFETIGGYRPGKNRDLEFFPGLFLNCFQDEKKNPINKWLIVDEINRADIDKAFGALFSAITGDDITLPYEISGKKIKIIGKPNDKTKIRANHFIIPEHWRIIATMNTFDKATLYEMSYAFMRRFAFIQIDIPPNPNINKELIEKYLEIWEIPLNEDICINLSELWKIINEKRKIGPAVVEDMYKYILDSDKPDYVSAIVMYVFPQFEGLLEEMQVEFIKKISSLNFIDKKDGLKHFASEFFGIDSRKFN